MTHSSRRYRCTTGSYRGEFGVAATSGNFEPFDAEAGETGFGTSAGEAAGDLCVATAVEKSTDRMQYCAVIPENFWRVLSGTRVRRAARRGLWLRTPTRRLHRVFGRSATGSEGLRDLEVRLPSSSKLSQRQILFSLPSLHLHFPLDRPPPRPRRPPSLRPLSVLRSPCNPPCEPAHLHIPAYTLYPSNTGHYTTPHAYHRLTPTFCTP